MTTDLIERGDSILAHYGVKGMKWGVRRADRKFERTANSAKNTVKIYNQATVAANKDLAKINAKYAGNDFTRDSPLRRKYYAEAKKSMLDRLEEAAKAQGTNRSGTKRYGILERPDGSWQVILKDVQHADEEAFVIKVAYDAKGKITALAAVPSDVGHSSMEIGGLFLEHYGVKGMKWGVRRPGRVQTASGPVPGRLVTKRGARIQDPKTLNNQDLKKIIARMEMEKKYKELNKGTARTGKKIIEDILKQAPKVAASAVVGFAVNDLLKGDKSVILNKAKNLKG